MEKDIKSKILTGCGVLDLDKKLSDFLLENKGIEVISLTPYFTTIVERFSYGTNDIANQWHEYTITILYK